MAVSVAPSRCYSLAPLEFDERWQTLTLFHRSAASALRILLAVALAVASVFFSTSGNLAVTLAPSVRPATSLTKPSSAYRPPQQPPRLRQPPALDRLSNFFQDLHFPPPLSFSSLSSLPSLPSQVYRLSLTTSVYLHTRATCCHSGAHPHLGPRFRSAPSIPLGLPAYYTRAHSERSPSYDV